MNYPAKNERIIQDAPVEIEIETSLHPVWDGVLVAPWLYQSLQQYYNWAPRPSSGWNCSDEINYQILTACLDEVKSQEDFDLLINAINHDGSLERLEEIENNISDLAEDVRDYFQQQKRERHEARIKREQEHLCVLCIKQNKLADIDVCAACRKEHWKEEQRIKVHLYRARKACTPATLTLGQWITTLERYHYHCAYCTTEAYEVLEHYIPITAGGGTTQENCVPACRTCNLKKHNDHPERLS